MWPDRRIIDLVGIKHPIIQAPMAGVAKADLAASVSEAGGLGSLACAMLDKEQARSEIGIIRQRTNKPINVNFFCHRPPVPDQLRETTWRARLAHYYSELDLDPNAPIRVAARAPFDAAMCDLIVELCPKVVSFHFGLPDHKLVDRVKSAGCLVFSSATTVAEARWLEAHGVDAIIAQGAEAGGHRGMFLTSDVASQVGTFALVPQVVDTVNVPVIAAGGIADARGIAAALVLGAAAVQIGTAYLFCPEIKVSAPYQAALRAARDDTTAITNVFTGRPARGLVNRVMRDLGPLSADAPEFPLAATALQPLRTKAEAHGSGDFSPLWAGQAASLGREMGAAELTQLLAAETVEKLRTIGRLSGSTI
jgi:nitronate monooxygenase